VFLTLVIQQAKRMRRIILSSVACLTVPHFPTLFHKNQNKQKTIIVRKISVVYFLCFSQVFLFCKKSSAMYYHKCISVFMYSTPYSCQILVKSEFSRQIFEKYSNIKFYENPSGWGRVQCGRAEGQTDRQT